MIEMKWNNDEMKWNDDEMKWNMYMCNSALLSTTIYTLSFQQYIFNQYIFIVLRKFKRIEEGVYNV